MIHEHRKFEYILDLLDQVVTKLGSIHAPRHDFRTGIPLYRSEIHTVQAVGHQPGINITQLAEHLGVTKGAVSQMINKLVKKGLVYKTRIGTDSREIVLNLTELGLIGFHAHEQFHLEMYKIIREYFGDEFDSKVDLFIAVMTDLNGILDKFERRSDKA